MRAFSLVPFSLLEEMHVSESAREEVWPESKAKNPALNSLATDTLVVVSHSPTALSLPPTVANVPTQ